MFGFSFLVGSGFGAGGGAVSLAVLKRGKGYEGVLVQEAKRLDMRRCSIRGFSFLMFLCMMGGV